MTPAQEPPVPASAKAIEKRIVTALKQLVCKAYPSCLDEQFRKKYDAIVSLFAQYQEQVLAKYPLPLTCGANCGVCCYHWPEDTYSFEVRYIADFIKKHRPKELPFIIKTLTDDCICIGHIKKAEKEKSKDPVYKKALGNADPYDLVLSSFYQFKRSCPLLSTNGSCSIYPIRPFTCRVYISFSPKEYCRPSRIASDKALTYLLDLEQNTSDLFDELHFMYDTFDGDTSFRSMLLKELTNINL